MLNKCRRQAGRSGDRGDMRTIAAAVLVIVACSATADAQSRRTGTIGTFATYQHQDEMTDRDRSWISTPGNHGGRLGWKCLPDGLNVMFLWKHYLSFEDDEIEVAYRFPGAKPLALGWDISTGSGNRTAFLPMSAVPNFTQQAERNQVVTLRVTDAHDGEAFTDTFDLRGLTAALHTLPCAAK